MILTRPGDLIEYTYVVDWLVRVNQLNPPSNGAGATLGALGSSLPSQLSRCKVSPNFMEVGASIVAVHSARAFG